MDFERRILQEQPSHEKYEEFFLRTLEVGNIPAPKKYRDHYFMDMLIYAEPVGVDPFTENKVYWGEGSEIACLLCDNPSLPENIPF